MNEVYLLEIKEENDWFVEGVFVNEESAVKYLKENNIQHTDYSICLFEVHE